MFQGSRKCSPTGRSCIKRWSNDGFNCSVACQGIFVDIQWEEDDTLVKVNDLKSNMERTSGNAKRKGDILNREMFEELISDYVAFKKQYVTHFRYSAQAKSSNFGK